LELDLICWCYIDIRIEIVLKFNLDSNFLLGIIIEIAY